MEKPKGKWHYIKGIVAIIGLLGLVGLFVYSHFDVKKKRELLKKHGKYEIATIVEKKRGHRSKVFFYYQFTVDGKVYKGSRMYYNSYGPAKVGYKFQVVYYPKDPTINRLLYDKRIKEEPEWLKEFRESLKVN